MSPQESDAPGRYRKEGQLAEVPRDEPETHEPVFRVSAGVASRRSRGEELAKPRFKAKGVSYNPMTAHPTARSSTYLSGRHNGLLARY